MELTVVFVNPLRLSHTGTGWAGRPQASALRAPPVSTAECTPAPLTHNFFHLGGRLLRHGWKVLRGTQTQRVSRQHAGAWAISPAPLRLCWPESAKPRHGAQAPHGALPLQWSGGREATSNALSCGSPGLCLAPPNISDTTPCL